MATRSITLPLLGALTLCASGQVHAGLTTADLMVGKVGPKFALADSDVTYVLTLTNLGPGDAVDVVLADSLPGSMSFVALTQTAGPTMSCMTPTTGSTGPINCTTATLGAAAMAQFDLIVHLDPATPPGTAITNSAAVSTSAVDPNAENDQATTSLFVTGALADVGVSKVGPAHVLANSDITYQLSTQNGGPDAATNVTWTDALPADLSFVSLTQTGGATIGCTTPPVGSSGNIVCTAPSWAAGATASWDLVTHVGATVPSGTRIINMFSTTSSNDGNVENDAAVHETEVSAVDLAVGVNAPAQVAAGATYASSILWRNDGPDPARQAEWRVPIPAGSSFVSIVQNSGPAAACGLIAGSARCQMATFASGASSDFTLNLAVLATAAHGSTIALDAETASEDADTDLADNRATASSTVLGAADVAIAKSSPAMANADAPLVYTIDIANTGFQDATTVRWQDTLPPGTYFVGLTQTSGAAFTCTTPVSGAGGTIDCSVATLAVAATARFTLTVQVSASVADGTLLTNSANVSSDLDSSTANNAASASSRVNGLADLAIEKTGPNSVVLGAQIGYVITLVNAGFQPATNVSWQDSLPPQTGFIALGQTGGPTMACTTPIPGAGGNVQCTIASLGAGASAQFLLQLDSSAAGIGDLVNTVSARTDSNESGAGSNSATATVSVLALPPAVPVPALDRRQLILLSALLWAIAGALRIRLRH